MFKSLKNNNKTANPNVTESNQNKRLQSKTFHVHVNKKLKLFIITLSLSVTTVIPSKKCNAKLTTVAVTHKATRMQTECVHWDRCHFDGCNQILVESETRLLKESLAPRNAQNVSIFDTLER